MIQSVHALRANDFPDVGNGVVPCCMGSAVYGPGGCHCWRAEYDQPQEEPKAGPVQIREKMCTDCAFRPDSPERQGDERYAHSEEGGIEEVLGGAFICHQGLRRRLRQVHPSGAVLESPPGDYLPPSPPCKADGSPAELCAGWAAELRRREGSVARG